MPTRSFARKPRRILTEIDGPDDPTVKAELKRRLAEIDAGEVPLLSESAMWQQAFGDEISPDPADPQSS